VSNGTLISRARTVALGSALLGGAALGGGAVLWSVFASDLGAETAARIHARTHQGMSYVQLVDLAAQEPRVLAICVERTGVPEAPCRAVRVVAEGRWLTSHSFPVTFENGVVNSIGEPEYDDW
jgi:hypothetical protein